MQASIPPTTRPGNTLEPPRLVRLSSTSSTLEYAHTSARRGMACIVAGASRGWPFGPLREGGSALAGFVGCRLRLDRHFFARALVLPPRFAIQKFVSAGREPASKHPLVGDSSNTYQGVPCKRGTTPPNNEISCPRIQRCNNTPRASLGVCFPPALQKS